MMQKLEISRCLKFKPRTEHHDTYTCNTCLNTYKSIATTKIEMRIKGFAVVLTVSPGHFHQNNERVDEFDFVTISVVAMIRWYMILIFIGRNFIWQVFPSFRKVPALPRLYQWTQSSCPRHRGLHFVCSRYLGSWASDLYQPDEALRSCNQNFA